MRLRLFTVGSEAAQHVFGPEGGIFGRSLKCDWVLPDPERILSSVHGRIFFENNRFMLVDESTNGIFVGDRTEPLGRGNAIVLASGATFRAGRLVIQTELLAAEVKPGPNYPASVPAAAMTSTPQGAEQALREREVWGDLWGKNSQDPLAYLDATSGPVSGQSPMPAGRAPIAAPSSLPVSARPVPQYQDPLTMLAGQSFAVPPVMPPAPAGLSAVGTSAAAVMPATVIPAAAIPPAISIPSGFAPQPVAAPPTPAAQPAKLIPDDFDPLSMILTPRGATAPASSFPAAPPVPTMPQPAPMPSATPVAAPAARPPLAPDLMADLTRLDDHQVAAPDPRNGTADPLDAMEAMKARRAERKTRLLEKTGGATVPPLPGMPATPATVAAPPPAATPPMPIADPAPASPAVAHPAFSQEAARALFRGMGFSDAAVPAGREAAVLGEVGEMVRAMSDGLVSLLAARKMLKSEFRMDETQVQPEENNPFKHFKMAELALDELFITRSGGFQAPAEAAASALDDVKGHVMLTMAAMQRAIRLLVERLDPKLIAREEEEGSARIRGLGARKGKWEIYSELHQRLSGNLDGMTRQIIGEAFAQVQEEQARRTASQFRESKK
ncbi:type VI secretion system-associated FHA domain protein TagH [Pseudomonas sp. R2.Fl]|nr:type VI secretion system-associated FHA domain protein TagH [Pseudomonas sp. R2.Fl]